MEERPSSLRWLLLGAALLLFYYVGWPLFSGKNTKSDVQPLGGIVDETSQPDDKRTQQDTCKLGGTGFRAELTTKGGSLRHLWLDNPKYRQEKDGQAQQADLVTPGLKEAHLPLRTDLRAP